MKPKKMASHYLKEKLRTEVLFIATFLLILSTAVETCISITIFTNCLQHSSVTI